MISLFYTWEVKYRALLGDELHRLVTVPIPPEFVKQSLTLEKFLSCDLQTNESLVILRQIYQMLDVAA